MSDIINEYPVIDALCGIDAASPQISQYTDNFGKIKFMLGKNLDGYILMIITDINGHVEIVRTDGETLIQETDAETGETCLLWNIGSEVTASHGVVVYQIVGYKSEEDVVVSTWYSKEGRLLVTESIDTTSYSTDIVGANPNLITQLIVECGQTRQACDQKVDKIDGKGLSACDFTVDEKEKLSIVNAEAQKNVQSDWSENDETSDSYIKNKPVVDQTLDIGSDNAIANWIVASQFDAMGEAFRITEGAVEKVKDGLAEAKILAGNLQTEADKHRNNEDVDIKHLTDSEKADVAKIAKIEADVEELQLGKADVDVVGNLASSVEMVKSELTNAKTDIGEINTQMDGLQMGVDSNTLDIAGIRTDIAILEADKINRKELQDALYPPTVTDVPATLAVNTAYNFGSQANITLAFPTVANDGDVIYVGFVSRDTTNLIVDTTNTFDFELIPEVNTGYEIYARCTTNEGEVRWIVKYSEYTGVTQ